MLNRSSRCGWIVTLASLMLTAPISAATTVVEGPIRQLKELHLQTALVEAGQATATIVAPADGRYAEAVKIVQEAVRAAAGVELPVIGDDQAQAPDAPKTILADRSVIALGNMSTSKFLFTLYRHWYIWTDLKYPGQGGFEVRSLHNPYGTGHNVILLGGSDGEGVLKAAKRFAEIVRETKLPRVGWLMEIQLGSDVPAPPPDPRADGVDAFRSWRDSWRIDSQGNRAGATPAGIFGFNVMSVQAAHYYATGDRKYLDEFLRLALPDPRNLPRPIRTLMIDRGAPEGYDLTRPLRMVHHYRAHLMPMIWDLIEESPLLTDEQRLKITNDLALHHDFMVRLGDAPDPEDETATAAQAPAGVQAAPADPRAPRPVARFGRNRHGQYYALTVFAEARYFDKYYPDQRWKDRLEDVHNHFMWWTKEPTWGERDNVQWIPTSTAIPMEYFILTDPRPFVDSGMARLMMSVLEILWSGRENETANDRMSYSMMHKASWLLNDGRYAYMAQRAGFEQDVFRVAQSWWPAEHIAPAPPTDRIGRISVFPLSGSDASSAQIPFDVSQGFNFLSYRTGLGPDDGFLLLDGFNGLSRNPHHNAALTYLRSAGVELLNGYGNQIHITRDGLAENYVARAARLDNAFADDGLAAVSVTVPDASYANWRRDILWIDDRLTLVADTVTAREGGNFELNCQWEPPRPMRPARPDGRWAQGEGERPATVVAAQAVRATGLPGPLQSSGSTISRVMDDYMIEQTLAAPLARGESLTLVNAVYADDSAGTFAYKLDPLAPNAVLLHGRMRGVYAIGPYRSEGLSVDAEAAFLGADHLMLDRARSFALDGQTVLAAIEPLSLTWNLRTGALTVQSGKGDLTLAGAKVAVGGGDQALHATADFSNRLARRLESLKPAVDQKSLAMSVPALAEATWSPRWHLDAGSGVRLLRVTPQGDELWIATEQPLLQRVDPQGNLVQKIELSSAASDLTFAAGADVPSGFLAFAGGKDNILRAFSREGRVVWQGESAVDPSYLTGDQYTAAWFTDPKQVTGISSLYVTDITGSGQREIALGRPSTVEFWSFGGELIARQPVMWGEAGRLALVSDGAARKLLVGHFYTGVDVPRVIDPNRRVRSLGSDIRNRNNYRDRVPEGATEMTAPFQRGIAELQVTDLNGDGRQEVIIVRAGHWNELRVYNTDGSQCLWMHSFGPAAPRPVQEKTSRFVRTMAVTSPAPERQVVVGLNNGWLLAFRPNGELAWSHKFPSAVNVAADVHGDVAAGLDDGAFALLDRHGRITRVGRLGGKISQLVTVHWSAGPILIAADDAGGIVALDPSR